MTPLQARRLYVLRTNLREVREYGLTVGMPRRVGWRERGEQATIIAGFCFTALLAVVIVFGVMLGAIKILAAVVRSIGW